MGPLKNEDPNEPQGNPLQEENRQQYPLTLWHGTPD